MSNNNTNQRRFIWFNQSEPSNKSDIWLSYNRRNPTNDELEQDDTVESVIDATTQRHCDLILKVYDCGKWKPILGFNSTSENKIDTVKGITYTYTDQYGDSFQSTGFMENDLPLFRKIGDSPAELYSAGTIGNAIYHHVTENEWKNIFEGDAFNYAFDWYFEKIVNEGDININSLLNPATASELGGIWADTFTLSDMYPNGTNTVVNPNNSSSWIAQTKYKYNHGTSDYNLYVNAKDIIEILNNWHNEYPEEPWVSPTPENPIDPNTLYNSFYNSPTVLKGWTEQNPGSTALKPRFELAGTRTASNRGKFLKLKDDGPDSWWLNPEQGDYNDTTNNAFDWVDLNEYITGLINNNNMFVGEGGVSISYNAPHGDDPQYVSWRLNHISLATDGDVCMKTSLYGLPDIEWVRFDELFPLLGSGSYSDVKYVVKGGGSNKQFLNGHGEWTTPEGASYNGVYPIGVIQVGDVKAIRIAEPSPLPTKRLYMTYDPNDYLHIDWRPKEQETQYQGIHGIHISGQNVEIDGASGAASGTVLTSNGSGGVTWNTIQQGINYRDGVGIHIENDYSININTLGASSGDVLSYDGSGGVEWRNIQSGEEYEAGDGIEIVEPEQGNKIIKGKIKECEETGYNSEISASTNIEFRAPSGQTVVKQVVKLFVDNNASSYELHPYTYTYISLDTGGTITFIIDGQTDYTQGDPIYVILTTSGKQDSYTVVIKDSQNNNSNNFISINEALVSDGSSITLGAGDDSKYLITMQFGIVKIEPLGVITVQTPI